MRPPGVDRVGLTWHPSLAARILAHASRIDIVEVIPEGVFLESRQGRQALRTLAATLPVAVHGVSLGLSSAVPVDSRRLDAFARLVNEVHPEHWSEHLAFVRAGGVELGHLAAPARTAITIEATAGNVERARRSIGSAPLMENVATLMDPPGGDRTEAEWLRDLLGAAPCDLLLDLHNLVANGVNFGFDPRAAIEALPAHRIRAIHLAGGRTVQSTSGVSRVLDDHRHAVPDPVYELLELVGERVPHPLDVVLERDGSFPPFEDLLAELDRARAALASGRARRRPAPGTGGPPAHTSPALPASVAHQSGTRDAHARVEALLVRLLTDRQVRARFLADPRGELRAAGVDGADAEALVALDRPGLELAAASLLRKRHARVP